MPDTRVSRDLLVAVMVTKLQSILEPNYSVNDTTISNELSYSAFMYSTDKDVYSVHFMKPCLSKYDHLPHVLFLCFVKMARVQT